MTLEILLAHPAVQALGRALLHFVWQGSLLALLLWIVKTIVPASSARLRYAAASLVMLTMPIALIVTTTWNSRSGPMKTAPAHRFSSAAPATVRPPVYDAPASSAPQAGFSGWVVCIWMIGVLLLSTRAAAGWMGVHGLKRGATPAGAELEDIVRRLKGRLGVSAPVRLCKSAMVEVPTAIGWLQPYILMPLTALTGLSEGQIAAILAHELAHIRRNDYLLNSIQTVIETILFYHPAVWWVGRQMRLEREHCCDDVAVAVCGSAIEYASALAEMEQVRDRIPSPALAATEGELLRRIRRVLDREDHASWSLGGIAAAALALSIIGATAILSIFAAPQEAPAFEVASIKLDNNPQGRQYANYFPTLHVERRTLKDLVILAYQISGFLVTGGPAWIASERYDIDAKGAEPHPAPSQEFVDLQRRRLQTLLRDRFHLAIHRETRELPIYELIVAKGGSKLQPANCIQREPGDTTIAPGKTPMDYCGLMGFGRGKLDASSTTMPVLAFSLSGVLERTVVDKTGIAGEYPIHLTYTPEALAAPPDAAARPGDAATAADRGPDIFTAVQEQLGLRLVSSKGPVEVLVIDRVERPSEN